MSSGPDPAGITASSNAAAGSRRPLLSAIRWGAVLAGVTVGISVQLVLTLLGIASGLSGSGPGQGQLVASAAVVWAGISMLVAAFVGGYVSARMSGLKRKADGVLHGTVSWAVTTLLFATLAGSAAGSMVSGLFGGVNPASINPAPAAAQLTRGDLSALLRRRIGGTVTEDTMKTLVKAIREGRRDDAIQIMVDVIGIDEARAASLTDQSLVASGSPQRASAQGRAVADRAAGAAGMTAWAVFLAVALSLLLGITGGAFGAMGSRRTTWSEQALADDPDRRRLSRTPA
jgi:uncharacterized protein YneF (UPF0154 family)